MVINDLISGISNAIFDNFGENYEIHSEEITQGLKEPCFYIACVNPNHKRFLGERYYDGAPMCIQYFPKNSKKKNEECNAVAERLNGCLEVISLNDRLIRGSNMHYEIDGGVLHYFVSYDEFSYVYKDEEKMETMKETQRGR